MDEAICADNFQEAAEVGLGAPLLWAGQTCSRNRGVRESKEPLPLREQCVRVSLTPVF
jgi:hypothetical protein